MFSRTSSGISGDLYKQSSKSHSTVSNWRCNPASHGITPRTSKAVRTAGSQRCGGRLLGRCFIVKGIRTEYDLMTNVIQLNMHGAHAAREQPCDITREYNCFALFSDFLVVCHTYAYTHAPRLCTVAAGASLVIMKYVGWHFIRCLQCAYAHMRPDL